MRFVLVAAFPQELKYALKDSATLRKLPEYRFPAYSSRYLSNEIIAVQAGMGILNSQAALNNVVREYSPDFIVSIGFGGAIYENAGIGDLVWASRYILIDGADGVPPGKNHINAAVNASVFKRLRERISVREGSIVTIGRQTAKKELKKAIPADIPFPVCDMETFHLALSSKRFGLPFFAIRSVTDPGDEDIPPELFNVCDESGNYSVRSALSILLKNPRLIPGGIKLGKNSSIASRNLWQAVKALMEVL